MVDPGGVPHHGKIPLNRLNAYHSTIMALNIPNDPQFVMFPLFRQISIHKSLIPGFHSADSIHTTKASMLDWSSLQTLQYFNEFVHLVRTRKWH